MLLDAIRRKFPSNAKAAERLLAEWKKVDRTARNVGVNSLATKLGELGRGRTEWWSRRPVLTQLLADLLETSVSDLLGRRIVPEGSLTFPEFAELPPLLPDEEPPGIDDQGWLLGRVRAIGNAGIRAFVAGPGMGKSFVVRWLQVHAADEFAVITTATLAGALRLARDPRVLVVDIDAADERTDAGALRVLAQRSQPTIVLTPFVLPEIPGGSPLVFDARGRTRLLGWIARRLAASERDTKLDLEEVGAWLRNHDPDLSLVATPADLLAFCADVDACGLDDASWELRARRWLRSLGPSDPAWPGPVDEIVEALCHAALVRREHPWGLLPVAAWSSLIPDEHRGPEASRWGRLAIVNALRVAGLLRGAADGLALAPSWVYHGLTAAALDRMLERDDPADWGLLAADETRQQHVDAALARRTNAGLCATVRIVARDGERRSLGLVAAREAVFTAAARRLLHPEFVVPAADVPVWHRLVVQQIASLSLSTRFRHPLTRRNRNGHEAFWADAWTFSARLPRPPSFAHPELAWHFPLWFDELPPLTRRHWPESAVSPIQAGEGVQRMAALALVTLARLPVLPEDPQFPRVLVPAAVLLAPARGWTVAPRDILDLPGTLEGRYLAHLLPQQPAAERTALADLLWEPLSRSSNEDAAIPLVHRLSTLRYKAAEFFDFILANLSDAALLRTIRDGGILHHGHDNRRLLPLLTRAHRRIVVREGIAMARQQSNGWDLAQPLAAILDEEDIDLILEIIHGSDKFIAAEFTGLVWRLAPKHALERALAAITAEAPEAHAWCNAAPREHLAELAERLLDHPRPVWASEWVESRLLASGAAAEALYALLDAPD